MESARPLGVVFWIVIMTSLCLASVLASQGVASFGQASFGLEVPAFPEALTPVIREGRLTHPNHLIVRVRSDVDARRLVRGKGRLAAFYPQIGYAVIWLPAERVSASKADFARSRPDLEASYDSVKRVAYTPNDPMWPDMWHSRLIEADKAWDVSFGSSGPVVAIMDTGVKTDHEDLAANMWVNSDEIAGNGVDDDANGYVDDLHGFDFALNDSVPDDVNGHGTACAGLAAAVQDNALGTTGVAPRARIMAVKSGLDNGYFYDSANIAGYLYAADNGADIISCSFYSDRVVPAEEAALDYAWSKGVLPVVAAGNDATSIPYYPGAYRNVLSVGAIDQNANKIWWSNFGSWVKVASPGTALRSTSSGGGYTNGFGGTSGACPQVAGLAALMKGANPSLTNLQLRTMIEDSASSYPVSNPLFASYGIIDCESAVKTALGLTTPAPKPSAVFWANPRGRENRFVIVRGRGLDRPSITAQNQNGQHLQVTKTRDSMEIRYFGAQTSTITILDGTSVLLTFSNSGSSRSWTPGDWATTLATLTGGFREALEQDGSSVVAGRRSNGEIRLDCVVNAINTPRALQVFYRRRFTGLTATTTERVLAYDWSSGSYPYGNWVEVNRSTMGNDWVNARFQISDTSRFIDVTGNMYLRIITETNIPSGGTLEIDRLNLTH